MKKLIVIIFALAVTTTGCATLTSDPMTPVAISFSDGSSGKCILQNKRGMFCSIAYRGMTTSQTSVDARDSSRAALDQL